MTLSLSRMTGTSPFLTGVDGLILLRAVEDKHPSHLLHWPALCVVIQGRKTTSFGSGTLTYEAGQAMAVRVQMPGSSQVTMGSPEQPYLSCVIALEPAALRQVYDLLSNPPQPHPATRPGAFVMDLDEDILSCVTRMLKSLGQCDGPEVLYPGLLRELCYYLLTGPFGADFAAMIANGGQAGGISAAIARIRADFAQALSLETLAETAGLSPSAFHRKFKALTLMTPLDYQKRLRLLEARRMMLSDRTTAEQAAFRVGYASPSQFSRDYRKAFGIPPRRDVEALGSQVRTPGLELPELP